MVIRALIEIIQNKALPRLACSSSMGRQAARAGFKGPDGARAAATIKVAKVTTMRPHAHCTQPPTRVVAWPQRRHSTLSTCWPAPKPMVDSTRRKSWKPRRRSRAGEELDRPERSRCANCHCERNPPRARSHDKTTVPQAIRRPALRAVANFRDGFSEGSTTTLPAGKRCKCRSASLL